MEVSTPLVAVDNMHSDEQQTLFNQLLAQHKGLLFKVIRSFASEQSDQDDLLQEISIQLWRALPTFRGEAKVTTWMYKIALFAAISWHKKETRRNDVQLLNETAIQEQVDTDDAQSASLEHMFQLIRRLNDIDRSITLLMLEGCSYDDIAQILGISASNVGVKINRIKKKLASMSKERNDGV